MQRFARLSVLIFALFAPRAALATWATVDAGTLEQVQPTTVYEHTWTGAAVDSDALDVSACAHLGMLEAKFDPSTGDSSTDATVSLKECPTSGTPVGSCTQLVFDNGLALSETTYRRARTHFSHPWLIADALTATQGGDTAKVTVRCSAASATSIVQAAPLLNVKSFGANGDGVTDDTAAIQTAIDAAAGSGASCALGGRTVFIPFSTSPYVITNTITVKTCVRLLGDFRLGSRLIAGSSFPSTTTEMVNLCGDIENGTGCLLENLTVDGNQRADYGVKSTRMQENSGLVHSIVRNVKTYGIYVTAPGAGVAAADFQLDDVGILLSPTACSATADGIHIDTLGGAVLSMHNLSISGCGPTDAGADCVDIASNATGTVIEGLHCELDGAAVRVGATGVTINGVTHLQGTAANPSIVLNAVGNSVFNVQTNATNGLSDTVLGQTMAGNVGYYIQTGGAAGTAGYLTSKSTGCIGVSCNVMNTLGIRGTGSFRVPVAATSSLTCSSTEEGSIYYDTNAGTAANPGRLCVCDDDGGGYKWHPVERDVPGDAGVPVNLTGNSTTDCGT